MKIRSNVLFMTYSALMSAILFASQVLMSGLPNINPVSFLIVMYTLLDKRLARAAIAIFVFLEGIFYGFHMWWISYLYIWYILHFVVLALKKWFSPLLAALVCGLFGLLFGTLTSLPYFITLGPSGAFAYIVSGIYFDILHCIGNFFICLILYTPMSKLMDKLRPSIQKNI